jgi:hypothetical protein
MKVTFRALITWATFHLMCSPTAAADDILAMLQSSLRVNQNQEGVEQNTLQDPESPDMKGISRLEALVMARVRDGLLGDDNLTATINASIASYYAGIISATAANQKKIILDIKAFLKCKTKMQSTYDKAIPVEKDFWILGEIYPKCIRAENKLKLDKDKVDSKTKTMLDRLKTKKRLAKAEEDKCGNVCAQGKVENYNEQLSRLADYYGKCKKKIAPRVADVTKTEKKYKTVAAEQKLKNAKYEAMKNKCKLIAYRMNNKKCKAVEMFDTSCSFYEECWKRAKRVYDADVIRIRKEEAEMKIEWRALHRIQCYLMVLGTKNDKDNKKEKSQLDKCIAIKRNQISTKHLDIDYKKIPKKPRCPKDPWCPCYAAYTNYYYRVGPKSRCVNNVVKKYKCGACIKKKR